MCRALQEQGVEIRLITTTDGVDLNGTALGTPVDYKNVTTRFFPVQWGESFKYSKPMASWLDDNVGQFDLVHIHAVFNHACVAAARACRKHHVPYVVRPLGTLDPWGMSQKRLMKTTFWHVSGKRMMRGASAVHYTTRAEKQGAEELLSLNHGHIVPLGIDLEIVEALLDQQGATQPPAQPYVLVLSRLHPKKRLEVLIDAFLKVVAQPEFREWRLVLAGDGPADYVAVLRNKASSELAREYVLFPGWLDGEAKKLFLQRASVLALPSHRENFGLCVMEALACGIPVIVSPQVNLSEAIEAAGAGWIVDLDREDLTATLREALSSEAERLQRGKAGKEMSARFTWPQVACEILDMYAKVLTTN